MQNIDGFVEAEGGIGDGACGHGQVGECFE